MEQKKNNKEHEKASAIMGIGLLLFAFLCVIGGLILMGFGIYFLFKIGVFIGII